MINWITLTLFYGLVTGTRNALKKKVLEKSPLTEVLFLYTFLSFIITAFLSLIPSPEAVLLSDVSLYPVILIKSLVVFFAWILSFKAIGKMPVSLFGVIEMSGIIFSTVFGIIFFNEPMGFYQYLGLVLVLSGIMAVNIYKSGEKNAVSFLPVFMLIGSCFFNSISGTMDKAIMNTGNITPSALQFWFMLCMSVLYFLYVIFTKTKLSLKTYIKNPLIIIMSIIFVLGDRALFAANASPDSLVTVMILIKQSSVIASIVLGRIMFKEKHILYRLMCAALIALGIFVSTMS